MKVICGICRNEKNSEDCHVVDLSEQEKESLASQGLEAQSQYHYCRPCWRLMSSKNAPVFMANQLEGQLQRIGVSPRLAKKHAERYKTRLMEMGKNATKD